jgi:DNA-binding transcriptional ArsR family regulator
VRALFSAAKSRPDTANVLVGYYIFVTTQIKVVPVAGEIESAVGMLKLLGDETRLRIIWALLESEHSVNELADLVGAQPAGVSQHLAKLRLARLVRTRRDGTRIFYVVDDAHVRRLVEEVLSHADHVHRTSAAPGAAVPGAGAPRHTQRRARVD